MAKRQVFYSFHYDPDAWRASKIRNIGVIEGNQPVSDNDWEEITDGGDEAIEEWIKDQLNGRSCTVVLVGSDTANRKWINHEIIESWNSDMGVVGIHINGITNAAGNVSQKGDNPFDYISYGDDGKKLSEIVECYTPTGSSSQERYNWISNNLERIVDEAIEIRG